MGALRKENPRRVAISKLVRHPMQSIFAATEETMRMMCEDIATRGLQEPILINREYVIISGHKRVEACTRLGWTEIPAFIRDIRTDDVEALIKANTARQLVGYQTRLKIYAVIMPELLDNPSLNKRTLATLAARTAITPATIRKDMTKYRNEGKENITIEKVNAAWKQKDPNIKIVLSEGAHGLYIINVAAKNFRNESGPGPLHEVLSESYKKACSTSFERAERSYSQIGAEIVRLRKGLGMTQVALAEALGCSQSYLAECEKGLYKSAEDVLSRVRAHVDDIGLKL